MRPRRGRAYGDGVEISFRKLSDHRHAVGITRPDGSHDEVELDSKDFLRHDLAHLAFELEAGLADGVWGSVARGCRLAGDDLDGADVEVAERAAGALQTLMRTGASAEEIYHVLVRRVPEIMTPDLAQRIHERCRRLVGHWASTGYGDEMTIVWPEPDGHAGSPRR